jgi:hypothetical protein
VLLNIILINFGPYKIIEWLRLSFHILMLKNTGNTYDTCFASIDLICAERVAHIRLRINANTTSTVLYTSYFLLEGYR